MKSVSHVASWSFFSFLSVVGCAVPVETAEEEESGTLASALVVKSSDTFGFGSSFGPGNPAATVGAGCGNTFGCAYTRNFGASAPQRIYQFCIVGRANSNIQPAIQALATAAANATAQKVQIGISRETTSGDRCGYVGGGGHIEVKDVGDNLIPQPASGDARISHYSVVGFSDCIKLNESLPGNYFDCFTSTLYINTGAILLRAPIESGGRSGASNIRQAVIRGALVAMGFGERSGVAAFTNPNFSSFTQALSSPLTSPGNWLTCQLLSLPTGIDSSNSFQYSANCPAGISL